METTFVKAWLGASIAILFAASLGVAKMRTKTIQILYPAQIVGATMLKPGIYQVGLDRASQSPTLDFYQNRKEVAQAPVKLVSSPTKNSETEVQYALPGTGT